MIAGRRLPGPELGRWLLPLALPMIVALYAVQGFYFARTVVPAQDAVQYLLVGGKVVRGEIGVYDDGLPGNRAPLPFYVLGLTQVLAGPSLRAARWLNVGVGVLTLLLMTALCRRLAGEAAALLAALFLATQGVVVAYYSYEGYPAFAAFCFTLALYVLLGEDSRLRRVVGAALVGLLFFVRSNLWPVIPFLLGYALWRARGKAERILLTLVVTAPPLVYLAWDVSHLKILAYVPVARGWVARLGYVSALVLDDRETLALPAQVWRIAQLARRYEFWALAILLLLAVMVWRLATGRFHWNGARRPELAVMAALLVFVTIVHLVLYSWDWKWLGFYLLSHATLVPILLGVGYAELLATSAPGTWRRRLLVAALVVVLVPPLYFVRNPLLPIGEMKARRPYAAVHAAAAHLRRVVPHDARVFFYGLNPVYYLSGLPATYLQQVYYLDPYPQVEASEWVVRRMGFVSSSNMRRWLSTEADWAVIDETWLEVRRRTPGLHDPEGQMAALLARYFEVVDTIAEYPYSRYVVYTRRARPGG